MCGTDTATKVSTQLTSASTTLASSTFQILVEKDAVKIDSVHSYSHTLTHTHTHLLFRTHAHFFSLRLPHAYGLFHFHLSFLQTLTHTPTHAKFLLSPVLRHTHAFFLSIPLNSFDAPKSLQLTLSLSLCLSLYIYLSLSLFITLVHNLSFYCIMQCAVATRYSKLFCDPHNVMQS